MKIFIALSEYLLKVRKTELLRFKGLKNYPKIGTKNARSWIKSIKTDKICDVM